MCTFVCFKNNQHFYYYYIIIVVEFVLKKVDDVCKYFVVKNLLIVLKMTHLQELFHGIIDNH